MFRRIEPFVLGLLLAVGLSRLYAELQNHACRINPDKSLTEMMGKFPDGAHTVPKGLVVARESLDWVATDVSELHLYPNARSDFVRITGVRHGVSECVVTDPQGTEWIVIAVPDHAQAGVDSPSEDIYRYLREDQTSTKVRP